ncbi:MAG: bacitracin ABC transporter ATP-binding protein [Halobacteriovorax sp.]|nr:bacitracin ABC transporter ATP-binding protein [Halobacteriovorax sp.]|tara:strand:+ start:37478 stop:38203 length:726 start_codon:yes stop_codon:yes gene_type:complete
MKSPIINISNLCKSYGSKQVLKGLTLNVEEGEIYGFLGPNGAGKSTTIRILIGLTDCQVETLTLADLSPFPRNTEFLNQIGVVQESQNLYENFTVLENLELFANLLNLKKERVAQVMDELSLNGHRDTKAKELSKGFKQRVLIARAFLHEPKILFLDEPTSGLDPIAADKVHRFIKELKKRGTTIFITSHFMEEVEELCDRVGFLRDGVIVEEGVPHELLTKYNAKRLKDIFLEIMGEGNE